VRTCGLKIVTGITTRNYFFFLPVLQVETDFSDSGCNYINETDLGGVVGLFGGIGFGGSRRSPFLYPLVSVTSVVFFVRVPGIVYFITFSYEFFPISF